MRFNNKDKIFAGLLIIIGILAFLNSFIENNVGQVFWFCYASIIIIGISIFKKDSFIIASQINLLAIPVLFWIIDFFSNLLFRIDLWGITNYFFTRGDYFAKFISLQHLITIPIAIYFIMNFGLRRKDFWKISLLQIILIFILTRIFTTPDSNINCAFRSCVDFLILNEFYPVFWFLYYALIIFITNLILVRICQEHRVL